MNSILPVKFGEDFIAKSINNSSTYIHRIGDLSDFENLISAFY
ncbi:MAG: hypothetical protein ACP5UV_04120 [Thermoplasmata archaeon]